MDYKEMLVEDMKKIGIPQERIDFFDNLTKSIYENIKKDNPEMYKRITKSQNKNKNKE